MRRPLALVASILLIAVLGTACASTLNDAATITYSVDGSSHELHLVRDDVLAEVRNLVANKQFVALLTQNGFTVNGTVSAGTSVTATWLTLLINQAAVDALFAQKHLHLTAAMSKQAVTDAPGFFGSAAVFSGFPAKFRTIMVDRTARREAVLGSFVDTSDPAGEAYFKAHQSQFACPSGRIVAHILVATKTAAQSILDQLKAGAAFGELAQKDSTDTQSGAQGGALGCLKAGEFVPPFEAAATSAPFDKPIGPVKSQFGFHVILVTHATVSYDAARSQVVQLLTQQGQAEAQKAITALLKSFHVHLDPRFGTWGHSTDSQGQVQYQVTPPKAPQPNTQREGSTTTTAPIVVPGSP